MMFRSVSRVLSARVSPFFASAQTFATAYPTETPTFNASNHQRLQYLISTKQYDNAISYFYQLIQAGILPTSTTNFVMAECFVKKGDDPYAALKQEGLYGVRLYNPVISAYGIAGNIEKVAQLFERMKIENIPQNAGTYSAMIQAYCKVGDMDRATEYVELMKQNNFAIKPHVFGFLITGYARQKDFAKAFESLAELINGGGVASNSMYNSIIGAYARNGQFDEAMKVLQKMKDCGNLPDVKTFATIVNGYLLFDRVDDAKQFAEKFTSEEGVTADRDVYLTFINYYAKNGNIADALEIIDTMKNLGVSRDRNVYYPIFSSYIKENTAEGAEKAHAFIADMKDDGVSPSSKMYEDIASVFERNGKTSRAVQIQDAAAAQHSEYIAQRKQYNRANRGRRE